jgi:hypothetical protein
MFGDYGQGKTYRPISIPARAKLLRIPINVTYLFYYLCLSHGNTIREQELNFPRYSGHKLSVRIE